MVADETVVSAISDRDASRVHREFRVQVDLDGTEEEKLAFVDPLLAADANDVYSVISHQDNAVDLYTMYGGFLFLGVFLGLLFLLSTVLIIYYKQISEGYEDQRRYQIMQQVGMSPREVRSSIRSQVLLVFFLPLVTAGIHVAAASPCCANCWSCSTSLTSVCSPSAPPGRCWCSAPSTPWSTALPPARTAASWADNRTHGAPPEISDIR